MQKFSLKIGEREDTFLVRNEPIVLYANDFENGREVHEEIDFALKNPISSERLSKIVKKGEKIVIITSDITRPMPSYKVLPQLLEEIYLSGATPEDITIVFALGSHRPHTQDEMKKLVGEEIFAKIKCVDSNPDDCINMHKTSRGTPVDITRIVAEADRRICLGNIEYHYFAGYSGGAKAIMPGVSTRKSIQNNHKMMILQECHAGNIDTNPLRLDIEEAGQICTIDFILNVVLDEDKNIAHAVAGDAVFAHREGCKKLDKIYKKEIKQKADIVIVSQGGAPKDLNLYQTQKALDNAKHAVLDGGIIILVGSCKEGLGEEVFEEWITQAEKSSDLITKIKDDFKLGGHKAAAIAMILEKAEIYLVSDMESDFVHSIFMQPFANIQQAYDFAIEKLGENSSVIIMPYGGSTLPILEK